MLYRPLVNKSGVGINVFIRTVSCIKPYGCKYSLDEPILMWTLIDNFAEIIRNI